MVGVGDVRLTQICKDENREGSAGPRGPRRSGFGTISQVMTKRNRARVWLSGVCLFLRAATRDHDGDQPLGLLEG